MEWEEEEEEEKERGEMETQECPAVLTWSFDKSINEKKMGVQSQSKSMTSYYHSSNPYPIYVLNF